MSFESNSEHEFYTFKWGAATSMNLFMLYPHPMPSSIAMVKPTADMMEVSFVENLPADSGLSLLSTTRTVVHSGVFEGEQLAYELTGEDGFHMTQYIFVLHDGERVWNGQLSGMEPGGAERVLTILSGAERVAE